MKFHNLIQGSDEWLEFRRRHVGASESPMIVLGNTDSLIKSKVKGKKSFTTKSMQRGHDLEPVARKMFCLKYNVEMQPAVVTHDELSWMSASLDGLSEDKTSILEIKCCSDEIHQGAKFGKLPLEHMIQIQHQLFVTELNQAYYCHFDGQNIEVVEIHRDESLINELIKKCTLFYQNLCDAFNRPDEEHLEIQAMVLENEYGSMLMKELLKIRALKVPLCEREKQIREKILELAPDQNFLLEGVLVHKSRGKITYDIDQMKLDGIDVKKYEKVGNPSWTISSK